MKATIALKAQHGGATLGAIVVLAMAMLLTATAAHRSLVLEQRTSANQYRAVQAFEAAEAGLEWALSQLNDGSFIDEQCHALPNAATGSRFLDRHRGIPSTAMDETPAEPTRQPRQTLDATAPVCLKNAVGMDWSCRCPMAGASSSASPETSLAFTVDLKSSAQAGLIDAVSTGCAGAGSGACMPHSATPWAEGRAQTFVTFGKIPALARHPTAALTAGGRVDLGSSPWQIEMTQPAHTGLAIRAGGPVVAPRLTVSTQPRRPVEAMVLGHEAALSSTSTQARFIEMFRMSKTAWQRQPAAHHVNCASACEERLQAALHRGITHPMVWLDQGLRIDTPVTLGSPLKPVLLMVDGPVRLNAPVVIHGLVYGTSSEWSDAAGSTVRGAVVIEGDLHAQGQGSTQITYDTAVLQRLKEQAGTFARVAGSWRDFPSP